MKPKYMITNGNRYIRVANGCFNRTFSFSAATRFSFLDGEKFIKDSLDCNPNWALRRISNFKSGRNYIITDGNIYVTNTTSNGLTGNYKKAKWFRSIADAQAYISNNRSLFSPAHIIDENGVEAEVQENRAFTDEQLEIIGVKKPEKICPRIQIKKPTREVVYENSGGKCGLCGRDVSLDDFTIDHVVPIARGGTNEIDNLQACCSRCNKLKSDMKNEELMQSMTRIFANTIQQSPNNELSDFLIRAIVRSKIGSANAGRS